MINAQGGEWDPTLSPSRGETPGPYTDRRVQGRYKARTEMIVESHYYFDAKCFGFSRMRKVFLLCT